MKANKRRLKSRGENPDRRGLMVDDALSSAKPQRAIITCHKETAFCNSGRWLRTRTEGNVKAYLYIPVYAVQHANGDVWVTTVGEGL